MARERFIAVPDDKALRDDSRKKGMVAGVSSGVALHAALAVASRPETAGKMIVVLLADTGERYITSALFAADASTGRDAAQPSIAADRPQAAGGRIAR